LQQDQPHKRSDGSDQPWAGLSEIDQAIRENRLTEYRWRKAWADPWTRRMGSIVLVIFVLFGIFVFYEDVIKR
jgi:hypothetical protein